MQARVRAGDAEDESLQNLEEGVDHRRVVLVVLAHDGHVRREGGVGEVELLLVLGEHEDVHPPHRDQPDEEPADVARDDDEQAEQHVVEDEEVVEDREPEDVAQPLVVGRAKVEERLVHEELEDDNDHHSQQRPPDQADQVEARHPLDHRRAVPRQKVQARE